MSQKIGLTNQKIEKFKFFASFTAGITCHLLLVIEHLMMLLLSEEEGERSCIFVP